MNPSPSDAKIAECKPLSCEGRRSIADLLEDRYHGPRDTNCTHLLTLDSTDEGEGGNQGPIDISIQECFPKPISFSIKPQEMHTFEQQDCPVSSQGQSVTTNTLNTLYAVKHHVGKFRGTRKPNTGDLNPSVRESDILPVSVDVEQILEFHLRKPISTVRSGLVNKNFLGGFESVHFIFNPSTNNPVERGTKDSFKNWISKENGEERLLVTPSNLNAAMKVGTCQDQQSSMTTKPFKSEYTMTCDFDPEYTRVMDGVDREQAMRDLREAFGHKTITVPTVSTVQMTAEPISKYYGFNAKGASVEFR